MSTIGRGLKTVVGAGGVLTISIVYLASCISFSDSYDTVEEIWLDMARPVMIEYPFELVEIGENGELGLCIGPNSGRGWLAEAGGAATYNFYAPRDDEYVIWAYCLWQDECTNAIYVQIDEADKAIIGNDPVFKRWHWVRAFTISLSRGFHVLRLSNHSDNVAIRRVFLTSSADGTPDDAPMTTIDLFRDTFNGCDKGNFRLWERFGGSWQVTHRDDQSPADNLLVGESTEEALLVLREWEWHDFVLTVSVKSLVKGDLQSWAGVCFGLKDDGDYYQLRWNEPTGADTARMQLIRKSHGSVELVTEYEVPWQRGKWHELELAVQPGRIQITVDRGIREDLQFEGEARGGIGLWLSGNTEAHFDDVHVWKQRDHAD